MIPVLLLVAAGAAASPAPSPKPPSADVALIDEVRDVASRVETVRGARPAPLPVPTRGGPEVRAALTLAKVAAFLPSDRLAARGRAWASLGFGDDGTPESLVRRVAGDLDGVALDTTLRRLIVDPDRLSAKDFGPTEGPEDEAMSLLLATGVRPDEPLVAHVLVHVLAGARGGEAPTTTDGLLARAAWTEGEANLVALLYLFRGLGLEQEVAAGHMDPQRVLGGRLAPAGLADASEIERSLLEFVSLEGFAQVRERLARGGWRAVEEAARARVTTRDVLHPDRAPTPAAALEPPRPPDGFAIADTDRLGEQGIVTLVSVVTGKVNLGLQTGDGWAGDALVRIEPPGKPADGYTLWETAWTGEDRARDFEYGIRRTLEARYPGTPVQAVATGGLDFSAPDGSYTYRIRRSGSRVTVRAAPPAVDGRLEKGQSPRPAGSKR